METTAIQRILDRYIYIPSSSFSSETNNGYAEGEFDPWRTLSPLSSESFSHNFKVSNEIPDCKKSTSKKEIFGYLVDNAQHCYDFRSITAFPGSATPVALFVKALKSWLKCFGK